MPSYFRLSKGNGLTRLLHTFFGNKALTPDTLL